MFYDDLNDFVQSAIILITGGILCSLVGRRLGLKGLIVVGLFTWHALFATYYAYYILQNGGDAFSYFQRARFDYVQLDFGTEFVVWLTSFAVSWGATYWPISFLYSVIGALGLTFFYGALRDSGVFEDRSWFHKILGWLCLLLPSISFWTSGIGKDSIACLSVGMFLWASMDLNRRQTAAIVAVLVMLGVRPHMAALMVLSSAAGTVFAAEVRGAMRFSAAALATAGAVFAVPFALDYAGATQFTTLAEYVSDRQEENLGGGSSVDIRDMNPVVRLLSFLYRPLPNEAVSIDQLAASMDNLFLMALTIFGLVAVYRAGVVRVFRHYSIALLYGFGGLILLSQVTANLGLATRQKWMVVPALMLVILGAARMASDARAEKRARRRYQLAHVRALR
jgi:hypothetical protein